MLLALFKKQFKELNQFYFYNPKTKKRRSTGGIVGMLLLFGFVFLSFALAFFGMGHLLIQICERGEEWHWLYFAIFGLLAIALGVIGSVFSTYTGLYKAKDNELLLSMPIQPLKILLVRMSSVVLMSLFFTTLVWWPGIIVYAISGFGNGSVFLSGLAVWLLIICFVSVLTCALGWVVALISSRLKNKTPVTVLLTIVLLGGYYAVYFKIDEILQLIVDNGDKIGDVIHSWMYPVYLLGQGTAGAAKELLIFALIVITLFVACAFILSKTFISIATRKNSDRKKIGASFKASSSDLKTTLFKKEMKRFTTSAAYMLNCGLGILVLPALAIVAAVKAESLLPALEEYSKNVPIIENALPAIAVVVSCLIMSTNCITAPSISLEGKNYWILRSLPIRTRDILSAKIKLHLVLSVIPSLVSTVIFAIAIRMDVISTVAAIAANCAFIWFFAEFGLIMNLKNHSLDWTNETVPIKQGASVMVSLFVGWGVSMVTATSIFVISIALPVWVGMLFAAAVLSGISLLLRKWIFSCGTRIFEDL